MGRGRPAAGPKMVDKLEGTDEAKKRLRVVLETVSGSKDVATACEELGLSKTAFFALRKRVLQASLDDLEPKPVGRPAQKLSEHDEELARLKEQNEKLLTDLKIAHVREELLLTMPEVVRPPTPEKKAQPKATKKKPSAADKRRKRVARRKQRQQRKK
jgi:hypothetical protein